jgi:mannose/cellobiose epimerase-like protein (N-acyl-D-glucosamine 2-epimerase family)
MISTGTAEIWQQKAGIYRATLLDDIVPFWLRHGLDHEFGGIITALDRDGSILDADQSRSGFRAGQLGCSPCFTKPSSNGRVPEGGGSW